ncbi:MAG: BTAD domain-containing putative transcriptional regulator, partial [Actinomycetota bacterium]
HVLRSGSSPATREQATAALWPDLPPERGPKNLRTTLNYVHDVLEPQRDSGDATWFVRIDGHRIRLHDSLDVDLWRFGDLLDQADAAERAGHPRDALPLLVEATALWGGDLAADLDYEWLELERIHARSRFVRASCRAAELYVATDSPGEAIEVITPALNADPYHEPSYRALATAYAELGDITSSRAVLRRAEAVLADV